MSPRLIIGLAIAALLAVTHIGVAANAYEAGSIREAAKWRAEKIAAQAEEMAARQALQAALDARTAELAKRTQEAADAVAEIRTEYLPGKTVIRREVVERPVFRDCRVGDGMRNTLNAALAGRPVPGAVDGGGAARVPGGARADG